MTRDFIVTADAHMVEPSDLFKTRLPRHLRECAAWEEQFETDPVSPTLATVARMSEMANLPMTRELAAERMINQSLLSPIEPGKIVCELIAGGVPGRYPNLHFGLIEFGGFWIAGLMGSFAGVRDDQRKAILGGTLAGLVGFEPAKTPA